MTVDGTRRAQRSPRKARADDGGAAPGTAATATTNGAPKSNDATTTATATAASRATAPKTAASSAGSTPPARAPTPPAAPFVPDAARALQVASALASLGTDATARSARAGVARALSTELLVSTRVEMEDLAGIAVADLRAGRLSTDRFVRDALAQGGPSGVAEAVAAFAWRVGAAHADLSADERAAFLSTAGTALDAAAKDGVALLARRAPVDARDAVATSVALSALLSGPQKVDTVYHAPADGTYAHHFDAFTNEPNLNATIDALPRAGGTVVGVSGGALHVAAATRADALVLTDINPEVRDFALVLGATLVVLDERAGREGWDDARLVGEVRARIVDETRGGAAHVDELRDVGVPERLLSRAPAMLRAVFNDNGANYRMVWFATAQDALDKHAKGTAPDVATAAGHLRALAAIARTGRLVAPVVDLADESAAARVGTFVAAAKAPLRTVHLSNMLDYVAAPTEVIDGVAALARGGPTTVISSTAGSAPDRRVGGWYQPAVQDVAAWTAPGGIRETFAAAEERGGGSAVYYATRAAFLPDEPPSRGAMTTTQRRADLRARIDAHYADDRNAYWSLSLAVGAIPRTQEDNTAFRARMKQLGVPPPRGPDDARALARALQPLLKAPA